MSFMSFVSFGIGELRESGWGELGCLFWHLKSSLYHAVKLLRMSELYELFELCELWIGELG